MCFSCKQKKVWSFVPNRMTNSPIKFDNHEVEQLRKKFSKIAGNDEDINRVSFMRNMGILGLQSAQCFSDRLFNSFDIDNDGKISFQDFVEYMQVLKCGSDIHKAQISFKLIDYKNKNKINMEDFKAFLDDFFRSWSSITNIPITSQMRVRTDNYVKLIFNKVKKDRKSNDIDFKYYAETIYKDKQFIQAFQFITQGVANIFISDSNQKENSLNNIFYKVISELEYLYDSVFQLTTNISAMFQIIEEEEFPQQVPVFISHFSNPNQKYNSKSPKRCKTGQDLSTDRSQIYNNTQATFDCSTECSKCKILTRKLDFLEEEIKRLLQETQSVYFNLGQQLKKDMERDQKMKKRGAVNNVHSQIKQQQGNMVFFGDDNWNLVLNMMIGIQMAVRSVRGYQEMIYEEPKDFNLKYYFELVPRRFGNQAYQSTIYSFTDYAPNTFNHIHYIGSIGPNKLMGSLMFGEMSSMTQLTSQGKSGSFFYYTADSKYMLKTIHYRQYKFLRNILQDYYYYLKNNSNTLVTKFFGLHKLQEKDDSGSVIRKSYFVIMANVFNTHEKIVQRYDIKGSWFGRQTNDTSSKATKKDNDFKKRQPLILSAYQKQKLNSIIQKDSRFFQQHNIIDYSLLVGVIKPKVEIHNQEDIRSSSAQSMIPSQENQTHPYGFGNQRYIFGIIDILTLYDSKKVMEYYFKRVLYGQGISAVPPQEYAERFRRFIKDSVLRID